MHCLFGLFLLRTRRVLDRNCHMMLAFQLGCQEVNELVGFGAVMVPARSSETDSGPCC